MTPTEPDFTGAAWFTSSYTEGNSTQCVEVAFVPGWVGVRDTKDHGQGPILTFTHTAWTAFLTGIHHNELTHP
ncbi:MAG: DUF397 domain-containing protein [Pseudonocardia sp.]